MRKLNPLVLFLNKKAIDSSKQPFESLFEVNALSIGETSYITYSVDPSWCVTHVTHSKIKWPLVRVLICHFKTTKWTQNGQELYLRWPLNAMNTSFGTNHFWTGR